MEKEYTKKIIRPFLFSFLAQVLLLILCTAWGGISYARKMRSLLGAVAYYSPSAAANGFSDWAGKGASPSFLALGRNAIQSAGYEITGPAYLRLQSLPWQALLLAACIVPVPALIIILCQRRRLELFIAGQNDRILQLQREKSSLIKNRKDTSELIEQYTGNIYHQAANVAENIRLCMCSLSGRPEEVKRTNLEIDHLTRLLKLLMLDQKIACGKARFSFHTISLEDLLQDIMEEIRPSAEMKHCRIIGHFYEPVFIAADEYWLYEAVLTICGNAVDAMPDQASLILSLEKKENTAVIQIFSSGTHLSEDIKKHLFERFYSSKAGHFGIGLHMAQKIAALHHGTLTSDNVTQDGMEGVSFTLCLPILNGAAAYG